MEVRGHGFFRLRPLRAGRGPRSGAPSYSGWQSRNSLRLRRQLEERQLELAALQSELRSLWPSERFLSRYDPEAGAPERVASAQRQVR